MLIYSAIVRDRAHLILLGNFLGTPFIYKRRNFVKKIVQSFLEHGREQAKCARNTHLRSPSSDATHPIFHLVLHQKSGFHLFIQRALYNPSQSSEIQKKLYGSVFDCKGGTSKKRQFQKKTVKTDKNWKHYFSSQLQAWSYSEAEFLALFQI